MNNLQQALAQEVEKRGSQAEVARWLNVSRAYVSDMIAGKRHGGRAILKRLGLRKITERSVTYEKAGK